MAGRPAGQPKTGGRQKGTPNKKTVEAFGEMISKYEYTPLSWLLKRLNTKDIPDEVRDRIATAAAPYCHARLAANANTTTDELNSMAEAATDIDLARKMAHILTRAANTAPETKH